MSDFNPYDWEYDGPWTFESESEASDVAVGFLCDQEVITDTQYVGGGEYEAAPADGYTIDDALGRFEAIAGGDQPFDIRFSEIGREDAPKLYFTVEVRESTIEG